MIRAICGSDRAGTCTRIQLWPVRSVARTGLARPISIRASAGRLATMSASPRRSETRLSGCSATASRPLVRGGAIVIRRVPSPLTSARIVPSGRTSSRRTPARTASAARRVARLHRGQEQLDDAPVLLLDDATDDPLPIRSKGHEQEQGGRDRDEGRGVRELRVGRLERRSCQLRRRRQMAPKRAHGHVRDRGELSVDVRAKHEPVVAQQQERVDILSRERLTCDRLAGRTLADVARSGTLLPVARARRARVAGHARLSIEPGDVLHAAAAHRDVISDLVQP
jgi:hypothetical protein